MEDMPLLATITTSMFYDVIEEVRKDLGYLEWEEVDKRLEARYVYDSDYKEFKIIK